jgi:hypothetical protein
VPKNRPTGITDNHFIGLTQASSAQTTVSVYGKIVKDSPIEPGTSGISHPAGDQESLQLAHVVGYSEGGRCVTLPSPQLIALPSPDGPADGCGWDPKEYVVWKNLPRNWTTLHLQATARSLHSALRASFTAAATAPTKPCLPLDQANQVVLSCSNADPTLPMSTPLGQVLPTPGQRTQFAQCVANAVGINPSQVPSSASQTLQQVVDAIKC